MFVGPFAHNGISWFFLRHTGDTRLKYEAKGSKPQAVGLKVVDDYNDVYNTFLDIIFDECHQ